MNLDLLNKQIKEEGKKFTLVVYRDKFQLRGTFRFQNGIKKRAYINLDVPAEEIGIREAKKRLDMIQYSIEDFGYVPDRLPFEKVITSSQENLILVKDAKQLFIDDWWRNRTEHNWWKLKDENGNVIPKQPNSLSKEQKLIVKGKVSKASIEELKDKRSWEGIMPYINKLDQIENAPLTVGALYQIAKSYPANSRGRKEIIIRFKTVIKLCKKNKFDIGGDSDDLDELKGKYTPKKKPNLTDDHLYRIIVDLREKMPKWSWAFGALYVWGCRPSEVFGLTPNKGEAFGTAHVYGLKEEQDGLEERTALGVPKHLIDEFNLLEIDRPCTFDNQYLKYDAIKAKQHTDSWAKALKRIVDKDDNLPKFTLYALRHAYARRLIKRNLPTATCAKSMGNDVRIFQDTYLEALDKRDISAIQKDLD